ncbi:MAG: cytochrome c biogenesis protein ResB [Acidobacteriota bacterium]
MSTAKKIDSQSQLEVATEMAAEVNESGSTDAQQKIGESAAVGKKKTSYLDEFLKLLSSVKFGIALLVILIIFSAIGTFVVQQGTSDFEKFFQACTPAERKLYEFLGFFDIYHVWYFNLLLLTLSLNIVLATIDRAPGHWHFFTQPKSSISESFARYQPWHSQFRLSREVYTPKFVDRIALNCRQILLPRWVAAFGPLSGLLAHFSSFRMRVTESKDGATTIFVERGVWNRLAFCAVHVALLMILLGWFVGNKWGQKGLINFAPGEVADSFFSPGPVGSEVNTYKLPFRMICTDIKQELIDPSKDLSPQNTLDWHTLVVFDENGKKFKGNVHLNEPVDFRGYRFFQSSFDPINSAREVTLQLLPKDGQGETKEVTLKRNGSVELPGVGKIRWKDFYPDFRIDQQTRTPFTNSGDYNRPAAYVEVLLADGATKTAIGFLPDIIDMVKQGKAPFLTELITVGNYLVQLKGFEKVSRAHTLQVQYDPGVDTVYLGCALLVLFLITVFFFSHERIWVLIKPGQDQLQLYFAGNTNRNRPAFEVRYSALLTQIQEQYQDAKEVKDNKEEKSKGRNKE